MWRTCWDFRSQFWASSGHSSRLPLKPRFRAIQRYKNYPLRAKIEVQRFSRPFCGSVGAKCASAHMMRSNTKIQINSANSDLILQAHLNQCPLLFGALSKGETFCVRSHTVKSIWKCRPPGGRHFDVGFINQALSSHREVGEEPSIGSLL